MLTIQILVARNECRNTIDEDGTTSHSFRLVGTGKAMCHCICEYLYLIRQVVWHGFLVKEDHMNYLPVRDNEVTVEGPRSCWTIGKCDLTGIVCVAIAAWNCYYVFRLPEKVPTEDMPNPVW